MASLVLQVNAREVCQKGILLHCVGSSRFRNGRKERIGEHGRFMFQSFYQVREERLTLHDAPNAVVLTGDFPLFHETRFEAHQFGG